jgi:integron integrase
MQPSDEASPFLQSVREAIRLRHLSIRTEEAYVHWVKRFILFHGKRHPTEMGEQEVAAFLTHLAVVGQVASSTQNQALNALVFLYAIVLERPLGECTGIVRAKRRERLPVVLTPAEVARMLSKLNGVSWLVACLQYGSGLRLLESVRLRVKDLDFDHRAIFVRDGKGGKDRVVTLPDELVTPLKRHLLNRRTVFERDCAQGFGTVFLPYALARKYPNAESKWAWQYVFAGSKLSVDPRSGKRRRHHLDESAVQKAVRAALRQSAIHKPASCHTLRLFCYAPARARRGHTDCPGATWSLGRAYDTDLYARVEARRAGGEESARRCLGHRRTARGGAIG